MFAAMVQMLFFSWSSLVTCSTILQSQEVMPRKYLQSADAGDGVVKLETKEVSEIIPQSSNIFWVKRFIINPVN